METTTTRRPKAQLCASATARPPVLLPLHSLIHSENITEAVAALRAAPITHHICSSSAIRCTSIFNCTSPLFSSKHPAPPARGLTPADEVHVRRQF
eukprot:2440277-Prymnesium_polylepis.1